MKQKCCNVTDASIELDTDNAWAADAEAGICTTFKDDGFASDTTWTPPLLISVNGCIDADVGILTAIEPTSGVLNTVVSEQPAVVDEIKDEPSLIKVSNE